MKRQAKTLRAGDVFEQGRRRREVLEVRRTESRMIVNVRCKNEDDGRELTLPFHRNEKVEVCDG